MLAAETFDNCNVNLCVSRLTNRMRERSTDCGAQNSLPHQDFWLFSTKVFAAFDFLFSKENVFPPFGSGENQSLFVLLIIVELVRFRFCWPTKLCVTQCVEFTHFSLAVFR
jgi:hypothetical protein